MPSLTTYIPEISPLLTRLEQLGVPAVMVGGMALILLGSRRVTQDFDFVVPHTPESIEHVIRVFYEAGFELASTLNAQGDIVRTIDNPRIASMRVRLDEPGSIFFYKATIGLRVDLMLDFPYPTAQLLRNAEGVTIASHTFFIASPADLLRMKELAYRDRKLSTDLQDIEFLKKLLQRTKRGKRRTKPAR